MGTRADFWVGRESADGWLGSIAWDGYPEGIVPTLSEKEPMWKGGPLTSKSGEWPEGGSLLEAKTEAEFRERVELYFANREDVTRPADGWPWPWETSHTTDFAYVWEDGRVVIYSWGSVYVPDSEDEENRVPFPDMSALKNVRLGGPGSGLIVMVAPKLE